MLATIITGIVAGGIIGTLWKKSDEKKEKTIKEQQEKIEELEQKVTDKENSKDE